MPHHENGHRGWRKSGHSAERLLLELNRRQLDDLDTCRRVWQSEYDPVAVIEAVRQSKLPAWLEAAVLVLLTEGRGSYPHLPGDPWRERKRHATDAERAAMLADQRVFGEDGTTWDQAAKQGERLTHERYDLSVVGPQAMKKAFRSVRHGLSEHEGRYYRPSAGLHERIAWAWEHVIATLESRLRRAKADTGGG